MRNLSKSSAFAKRTRSRFGAVLGTTVLAVAMSTSAAYADPPHNLPQNAGGYDASFSPAYDYDTDGCYPASAIDAAGNVNQIGRAHV